ncbi:MAG: cache domain-containing protein, partial [Proteobacteria bacterium]|nr:cache domain-containing protein [Pseudomonadota bacterium]
MVVAFTVASFGLAFAAGTADEAKKLVEKAAAYCQANGREKAVKAFNNPKGEFIEGDLYIFAWDLNGISIANPYNPKQLGVNVVDLPDVDGKFYRKEAMETIKKTGSAWADYKFRNPKTGKVEHK